MTAIMTAPAAASSPTATSLKDAITAVTEAAIAKLGGSGYSTLVPKELSAAAAL
jgi:hypothetical protein